MGSLWRRRTQPFHTLTYPNPNSRYVYLFQEWREMNIAISDCHRRSYPSIDHPMPFNRSIHHIPSWNGSIVFLAVIVILPIEASIPNNATSLTKCTVMDSSGSFEASSHPIPSTRCISQHRTIQGMRGERRTRHPSGWKRREEKGGIHPSREWMSWVRVASP